MLPLSQLNCRSQLKQENLRQLQQAVDMDAGTGLSQENSQVCSTAQYMSLSMLPSMQCGSAVLTPGCITLQLDACCQAHCRHLRGRGANLDPV